MVPSVTVVIPAFNAERFLGDALDSVAEQTVRPMECIVVDDGSGDDTRVVATQHPACTLCVTQSNRGVSAARNAGAALAGGDVLAFLDADDAWLPTRLERMMQRMARGVQAVLCSTWLADEELNPQTCLAMEPAVSAEQMLLWNASVVSPSSNILIQRSAFDALGGFNESFATSADWYLTFRVVDELTWVYEPEPLVLYRSHPGGMSRNIDRMAAEMQGIYNEIFASSDTGRVTSRRKAFGSLHRVLAGSYFANGRLAPFVRHAGTSLMLDPEEALYFGGAARRRLLRYLRRRRRSAPADSGCS